MIVRSDWTPFVDPHFKKTARIKCFACKTELILDDHRIDDTGVVSPRVVCPHCKSDNGEIRLAGWPFEIDFR